MFKIEELSGSLIKSGRFVEAIAKFFEELDEAQLYGFITRGEMRSLQETFAFLLLNPSAHQASSLGDKMIALAIRIPGKVPVVEVSPEDFEKNVKESREA